MTTEQIVYSILAGLVAIGLLTFDMLRRKAHRTIFETAVYPVWVRYMDVPRLGDAAVEVNRLHWNGMINRIVGIRYIPSSVNGVNPDKKLPVYQLFSHLTVSWAIHGLADYAETQCMLNEILLSMYDQTFRSKFTIRYSPRQIADMFQKVRIENCGNPLS